MIDDSGAAQLDVEITGDIDNYRYSAPETQFPKDHGKHVTLTMCAGDVYAMGMIIYEASSHHPGSSNQANIKPYLILGPDGEHPIPRVR